MDNSAYQVQKPSDSERTWLESKSAHSRNALAGRIKLDIANLAIWVLAYGLWAYATKLMIDERFRYPILQVTVGFVIPMVAFIIGIVGNFMMLASQPFGNTLAQVRLAVSTVCALASVPVLGFESHHSFMENVLGVLIMSAICAGCVLYYHHYRTVVTRWHDVKLKIAT